jgi:hypothetical protein
MHPRAPGARVWTSTGYSNHGPFEGQDIDVAAAIGGTIVATEEPYGYSVIGQLLCTIDWDNGQHSKHYSRELFGIGRFESLAEFESAVVATIDPTAPVQLHVGPAGGFRKARLQMKFGSDSRVVEIRNRDLWSSFLLRILTNLNIKINENRESKAPRRAARI